MRIWTIHPQYLDPKGLGGAWREALGAQKSLYYLSKGIKIGYSNHSQLIRFKQHQNPMQMLCNYMHTLVDEAERRGYSYNRSLIQLPQDSQILAETNGQLEYEWQWLAKKLKMRDPQRYVALKAIKPSCNPVFKIVAGPIQPWEKIK